MTYLFRLAVNNAWRYWRVLKDIDVTLQDFILGAIHDHCLKEKIDFLPDHHLKLTDKGLYCSNKNKKSNTNYYCLCCKVNIHPKCFGKYHLLLIK